MILSDTQLEQFNKDGFLVLRKFLDVQNCDGILQVAQKHLSQQREPIETESGYTLGSKEKRRDETDYNSGDASQKVVRRLRQVYTRDMLFKEWMENKKIRPILQQILNDDVVLVTAHHNSIMTKMPYVSSPTSWHQDRRYWQYTNDNLVSVWLALDAETSMNGVLEFIPGSHKMQFTFEQFDKKEYFSETYLPNKKVIEEKVSSNLAKGDVVLFHSLLLHRANQNQTDRPKISFVYTVKGAKTDVIEGSRSSKFPEILLKKV
jgi:phytanoyl-CoA hydroxylase